MTSKIGGCLTMVHKIKHVLYRHFPNQWRLWKRTNLESDKYDTFNNRILLLLPKSFWQRPELLRNKINMVRLWKCKPKISQQLSCPCAWSITQQRSMENGMHSFSTISRDEQSELCSNQFMPRERAPFTQWIYESQRWSKTTEKTTILSPSEVKL